MKATITVEVADEFVQQRLCELHADMRMSVG